MHYDSKKNISLSAGQTFGVLSTDNKGSKLLGRKDRPPQLGGWDFGGSKN